MKNKIIDYLILIIIIPTILLICIVLKYKDIKLDDNIYDKKWYKYNHDTGYYDIFTLSTNKLIYYNPNKKNAIMDEVCSSYNYDKKTKTFNLDCDKTIQILKIEKEKILLNIDGIHDYFYLNKEDANNIKFKEKFGVTKIEYKKNKEYIKDIIKINNNDLQILNNIQEYSKILLIGDKCSSIECTLYLDILEKWMYHENNIYFIDLNDITTSTLFNKSINELNSNYPTVLIIDNNQIIDKYQIKCDGFNCSKYE